MDRSSVASTAIGSDQTTEFYDTPPGRHSCSCCAHPSTCSCCAPGSSSVPHHHHHGHASQQSHYQSPACLGSQGDPMENYDVPPLHPHGGITAATAKEFHSLPQVARSVNGEGKMPLVSGALPPRTAQNAHAIYAQVDKTKKTPRQLPMQHHLVKCDSNHQHQPIYENHSNAQYQQRATMQPTYANVDSPPCKVHEGQQLNGKPAAEEINNQSTNHRSKKTISHSSDPANNYVNLEFAGSLLLYENAQEIRKEPKMQMTSVQSQPGKHSNKTSAAENSASDLLVTSADVSQKSSFEEVTKKSENEKCIPEEKTNGNDVSENEYENTRELCNENSKKQAEATSEVATKKLERNSSSDPPSVLEEPSTSETAEASTSSKENVGNEEPNLPLRRSSSVPCKGGHANRGSASSSDSGVSGDGGLFFDDTSPLNDIGR